MNRWNIPAPLEAEILARDAACIYCGIVFILGDTSRRTKATWEHIVNDARIISRQNIARCCASCNASKGARELSEWLLSSYCARKGIAKSTMAEVARIALANPPSWESE